MLALFQWLNGMWMYQMQPHFFNLRNDATSWLFMQTKFHLWLIDNKIGWILMDTLFYSMPLLYYFFYNIKIKKASIIGVLMLIINWAYVQSYVLFPTNSIEWHIAWLFTPFLFIAKSNKTFYFLMHGIRYYFLFFFVSAGMWKIYHGAIFNLQEMSAILLNQHKEYLVSDPNATYTYFIYWLVNNQSVSYLLYIVATVLELVFIVGFFTKKYDRYLLMAFVAFLLMDLFIMRIPYFEVLPVILPLLFSRFAEPGNEVGFLKGERQVKK